MSKKPQPGEPTPKPYPYRKAPKWPTKIGTQPAGLALHACMGLNSCRGSDRFGLEGPPDGPSKGKPNECAGQGYCSTTPDHLCHVQNQCKNQGGCGLYGTADELDRPGINDCKALGSCATPINAERFSTNGPNQGKSVWKRARQVFYERTWPDLWEKNPDLPLALPAVGGKALADATGGKDIFADGPAYLWVSNDNKDRTNMTACGASGLSGAGGCG